MSNFTMGTHDSFWIIRTKNIFIFLFFLAVTKANAQNQLSNDWVPTTNQLVNRRQSTSYVNNVIHQTLDAPDNTAESSVNVNFHVGPQQQQIYKHNTPQEQQTSLSAPKGQINQQGRSTQLINVGYSVSFDHKGQIHPNVRPTIPRTRSHSLEQGEIITGIRKQNEQVVAPTNLSTQDYVYSALEGKQHKISGIKPKQKEQQSVPVVQNLNANAVINQGNFAPLTQKYLKALERVKTPRLQDAANTFQQYHWKNLSPNVEIIKSTEVPINVKNLSGKHQLKQGKFDHAKAMGLSQGFDFNNALEGGQEQYQNTVQYHTLSQSQEDMNTYRTLPQNSEPQYAAQSKPLTHFPIDTSLLRRPIAVPISAIPYQIDSALADKVLPDNQNNYQEDTYQKEPSSYVPITKMVVAQYHPLQKNVAPTYQYHQDYQNTPSESESYLNYQNIPNNQYPNSYSQQGKMRNQFKMYGKPMPNSAKSPYYKDDYIPHMQQTYSSANHEDYNLRQPRYKSMHDIPRKLRSSQNGMMNYQRRFLY